MASGLATLAATGSAAIVTADFAPDVLTAWGWRIPFLVGGILGWSVLCCGHAPTRPPNSRRVLSSTRSQRRHGCGLCSADTRRRWRLENVLGYKVTRHFEMKNIQGAPLYNMIFASDNDAGEKIMKHIYGKAGPQGAR